MMRCLRTARDYRLASRYTRTGILDIVKPYETGLIYPEAKLPTERIFIYAHGAIEHINNMSIIVAPTFRAELPGDYVGAILFAYKPSEPYKIYHPIIYYDLRNPVPPIPSHEFRVPYHVNTCAVNDTMFINGLSRNGSTNYIISIIADNTSIRQKYAKKHVLSLSRTSRGMPIACDDEYIYIVVDREPQDNTAVIIKVSQSDGNVIDSKVISLPSAFIFATGMEVADNYIVIRFVFGYETPVIHLKDVTISILTKDLEHVRTYRMIEPYFLISSGNIAPNRIIRFGNELYIANGVPIGTIDKFTTGIYRLSIDDLKIFDAVRFTSTQYDRILIDINKYMDKILLYGTSDTPEPSKGIIGLADKEMVNYRFVLYGELLRLHELIEGTIENYSTGLSYATPISRTIHVLTGSGYTYRVDNVNWTRNFFVYGVVDPRSLLPPKDCGDFSEEVDIGIEHYTPTYEDISDQVSVQPYTISLVDADIEPDPNVELEPVRWCG